MSVANTVTSELDLTAGLIRVSALVQDILATASAEHGLTAQQAQLMCVVGDHPSPMLRLSQLMRIGKSSTTGLVRRAENAGLITRAPDPVDGRSTLITLSDKGRAAHAAYRATVADLLDEMVATVPPDMKTCLTSALSTIVTDNQAPQTWTTNETSTDDTKENL